MVRKCYVKGCGRKPSTHPGTRLYSFPKNPDLHKKWVEFCSSDTPIPKSGGICDAHFEEKYKTKSKFSEILKYSPQRIRNLIETAIPTLNRPSISTAEEDAGNLSTISLEQDGDGLVEVNGNSPPQMKDISTGFNETNVDRSAADITTTPLTLTDHLDLVIRENEELLNSPLCTPESGSLEQRSERLLLLKEENRNLSHLTSKLKIEVQDLKTTCKTIEGEADEWMKKFNESQKDNRELRRKLRELERTNHEMDIERKRLKKELEVAENLNTKYEKIISKYFTEGQIKRLKADKTFSRMRWSAEDIASAISLRCVSIKAYRYLKYKVGHPLPHIRTLRRWAQKVTVQEGVIDIVLELMKHKGKSMRTREKLTILSYDEMSIDSLYCYCRQTDTVYGDVEKVQVLMARGLMSSWKQPVAFFYDTDMTKGILDDVLKRLHDIDFDVVGINSDLGGENRSFQKELGLSSEFTSFQHPCDKSKRVFCFADAPHMIKLCRNHFLDQGYKFQDTEIRKDVIEKILKVNKSELNIKHRLSQARHLDVHGNARQRVGPAVELMSTKTADLIDHCCETGKITVRNHEVVSRVFRACGDYFAIFNNVSYKNPLKNFDAYGLSLKEQNEKLDEIVQVIGKIRKIHILKSGKNTDALLPFQHGILMSIKSLREMLPYLQNRYPGIGYILTKRLNQDCLENFFGYIRGMSDRYDHPSPTIFKYRMKLYILGKHHSTVFVVNKNTSEILDEECIVTPSKSFAPNPTSTPKSTMIDINPTATCQDRDENPAPLYDLDDYFNPDDDDDLLVIDLGRIDDEEPPEAEEGAERHDEEAEGKDDEGIAEMNKEEREEKSETEDQKAIEEIWKVLHKEASTVEEQVEKEGFEYLAGYVAHKFRLKFTNLGMKTSQCDLTNKTAKDKTWLEVVSKGSLLKPSEQFKSALECVEAVFLKVHGKDKGYMKKGKDAVAGVLKQTQEYLKSMSSEKSLMKIPEEVIRCYIRVRTFFRIRTCSERIKAENLKKANAKKFNNKNNKLTGNKNKKAKKLEGEESGSKENLACRKRKTESSSEGKDGNCSNNKETVAKQKRKKGDSATAKNVGKYNERNDSSKA